MRRRIILFTMLLAAVVLVAACAQLSPTAAPLPPTKTPKPTFTHTPAWTATPVVFPTATSIPATPTPEATATPEVPPTPTPVPVVRLTANQNVNVRRGPGTAYPQIGTLRAGDTYEVKAQNTDGTWLQFDLNGQAAWVTASLVSLNGSLETVEVAQNIPAPPAPTARPRPTAVPQPPTAVPAPVKKYEFNVALVQRCDRQPAGNWFDGTVYKNGQPINGIRVVFSYAPDGPWATPPQISGPHEGYTNWNPGYYSHIINSSDPKAGTWFVWLVNATGTRISEMASWQSTGPGDGCNQATVDFDSR